jgi:hypothetical protein
VGVSSRFESPELLGGEEGALLVKFGPLLCIQGDQRFNNDPLCSRYTVVINADVERLVRHLTRR